MMRPNGVSRSQWKNYIHAFWDGCELWTSEDGSLLSLAIIDRPDWEKVLSGWHVFQQEKFDAKNVERRFVKREWVGADFYNGSCGQRRGKVWNIVDEAIPFPVIEYTLQIPR